MAHPVPVKQGVQQILLTNNDTRRLRSRLNAGLALRRDRPHFARTLQLAWLDTRGFMNNSTKTIYHRSF